MTRVSVLMGIYNCAPTLQEALDSLYAQTFSDIKIILCDDGSTDDTYKLAKKNVERHDNVILVRNKENRGLNFTLNRCLELADSEYCARMDGDDISMPTRFEKEIRFLDEHPEYSVVSSPMIYFDEKGDYRKGRGRGEIKAEHFINGTPICHAPCMFRTEAVRSVGGYSVDDRLIRVEDYHLWFKMFSQGYKLYVLDECLYKMRDDRNALKRRNWKSRRNEAYVKHIGYRMIGLPWYNQIFAIVPIIKFLTPGFVYKFFHYRRQSL